MTSKEDLTSSQVTARPRISYLKNHDLVRTLSEADLSNYVELATDLVDCSMGYISVIDENRTIYLETKNMETTAYERERTPDLSVVESGSPRVNEDLKEDGPANIDRLKPVLDSFWRGWAAVPLSTPEQHILGTVGVASRVPRQFNRLDIHCLHTIAWEITNRIHGSFDENSTESERDVLKTAVEELTLFRNLVDESNDAFMVLCPDSARYIRVNDEACRQTGYDRNALLEMTVMDLIEDFNDAGEWDRHVEDLRENERMFLETRLERRNGSSYPVEISFRYDRTGQLITAVVRDITVRKNREDELKRVNRFLEHIVGNMPGIIFVKSAEDLSYELCNHEFEKLVDRSRDEIIGRTDYELFSDEEAEFYRMQDREVLSGGEKKTVNEPLSVDGERRIFRSHKVPITDEDGEPLYLLGLTEDVTERERMREKLERKKKFLQQVLESSPDPILVVDEDIRLSRVNNKTESMFGYDRKDLLGKKLGELIPERFRDNYLEHLQEYFDRKDPLEVGTEMDLFGLTASGDEIPLKVRLSPLRDDDSRRLIATIRETAR